MGSNNIILIGFATTGKTSVGTALAQRLGMSFADTDALIEQNCQMTAGQIFRRFGEAYFRAEENKVLLRLSGQCNTVISCGGGAVLSDGMEILALSGKTVWLTAEEQTVKRRLGNTERPLFDDATPQKLSRIISERTPYYRRFADVTVATDNLTVSQVADVILCALFNV